MDGADSAFSYWCRSRADSRSRRQSKLVLTILPFILLIGSNDKIVVLLELSTLLDMGGVARHGC